MWSRGAVAEPVVEVVVVDADRGVPAPAPVGTTAAPPARPRRAGGERWPLVALAIAAVGAVITLALVAVNVAGRAGTTLDALFPPGTVLVDSRAGAALTDIPPTTPPVAELSALRGRPPSPVAEEEPACSPPLRAGKIRPQKASDWAGRSSSRSSGELSDADARLEIAKVMRRRFRRDDPEQAVREALQLYESPKLRQITGDSVVLRASLAVLKGSLGEPVLRFALTTQRPVSIVFGTPVSPSAGAEAWGDGHRLTIVVREEYRHEAAAVLAPIVFHELMHENGQSQLPEEIVNNVLDIRITIEMIRDNPSAFTSRSKVVDSLRFQTLLQLNTRVGSVLAVERSDVDNVAPDFAVPVRSIGAFLRSDRADDEGENLYAKLADAPSKGHAALAEVLRMVAPAAGVPDKVNFDRAAVDLLDTNAGVGLCDQLVAAEALGLIPRGSSAQRLARAFLDEPN